jgi:cellulose synthase/poly-beta-1,6-N-acetylglucosamine synthase-like glycosyltransferase
LVFILFYIYFFYPLILCLKPVRRNPRNKENESFSPTVSVLVPVYNEEKYIEKKILNILEQDYPKERIEILIASDGSTDRTVELAGSFTYPNLKVFEHQERRGKNSVLNDAERQAKSEILVFTDVNSFFVKDAIRKLIHHFQDPKVGLVCGHLKYLKGTDHNVGKGEGLYFKYEALIKRLESGWGTVAVVTGAIYAMRRDLFTPLDLDVANDFAHPVQVGAKGYKVVFEPEAIAYEQTTSSISEEFKRRVRITTRGFTAFGRYWKTYRILQGKRGFCFISHKLLRWFVPFFLIALFITNLFLTSAVLKIILFAQLAFYCAAMCGMFIKGRWGKLFIVPFYFCMINLAALVAFINYLRGKRQSRWEVAATTR